MTEVNSISSDKGAAPANLDVNKPAEVEIKVGDKTMKVSAEVANELSASRKAAEDAGVKVGALSKQMEEVNAKLEAALKPSQKAALAESGETPLDVLLFTDPQKAIKLIQENTLSVVRAEQAQENSRKEFWSEFYSQNKDLKEFEGYVQFVFNRELPGLVKKNMTVGDTIKEVSKIVKTELLKIKGPGSNNKQKAVGEGGSESGNSGKNSGSETQGNEELPPSTASILAERREARRQARTQVGKRAEK